MDPQKFWVTKNFRKTLLLKKTGGVGDQEFAVFSFPALGNFLSRCGEYVSAGGYSWSIVQSPAEFRTL